MKIYVMKILYMANIYGLVTEINKKNYSDFKGKNRCKITVFTFKTAVNGHIYITCYEKNSKKKLYNGSYRTTAAKIPFTVVP
jgi:hypothetical protein